tara:strand:+ start:1452 stop:1637 length:186 start_codon:yes stop_codon:yes gene_type:complete
MTEHERLLFALIQTKNIIKLTENNPYGNYLHQHLSSVKYELERQVNNLSIVNTTKECETNS